MNSQAVAKGLIEAGSYTAIGISVAQATGLLQPAGGALFGVVTFLSGKLIAEGLSHFFGSSPIEKILKVVAERFGGLLIGLGTMLKVGYKINFVASLQLGLWMIPLTCVATNIALPMIMKQVS